MKKRKILFYWPDMEELARGIVAAASHEIELGRVAWDTFERGWPNFRILEPERIRRADVCFLASFEFPERIFPQMAVVYAVPRYHARSLQVVLPYFPGTMDRVDEEGQIATAKTVVRLLESIPHCHGSGPSMLTIFDIHALPERFYFDDRTIPDLLTAIPLLLEKVLDTYDVHDLAFAFPDDGAVKRFGKQLARFPRIICNKVRHGANRIVTIKEGDPRDKDVVIIDDLANSGETLIACKEMLVCAGARSVSGYVTHGVFPDNAWQRILATGFKHFWITDSCPTTVQAIRNKKPFEVVSLAGAIARAVIN